MILVSACLMGEKCRYDGGDCQNGKLIRLLKGRVIKPVCPEKMGGLDIPRPPAEILNGDGRDVLRGKTIVRDKNGRDVTGEFITGGRRILLSLREDDIEFAVLKARSPSCGTKSIYDGSFTGKLREGPGVFAALLSEKGIDTASEEELEKIKKHLK